MFLLNISTEVSTSDIVNRAEKATPDSLVASVQGIADGLYQFVLSLSDPLLTIGIVIVIGSLIVGIFTGIGKALRVAFAVILVYFLIIYAPEIIGMIKSWITGSATAKPGG